MRFINKLLSTFLLSICVTTAASATVDFWEEENTNYTIYFDGGWTESYYYNLQTPRNGAEIINVEWEYFDFDNGFTTQTVYLCYRQPYSNSDFTCLDISSSPIGAINHFDGFDARGTMVLRYTLIGGTYYAYWNNSVKNKIKVTYDY